MYYVYCYKDPDTLIPFYIGKGKTSNRRHLDHLKETADSTSNRMKYYKIQEIMSRGQTPIIEIIEDGLSEDVAYELEAQLIHQYGKRVDRTGVLTNILDDARPPSHKGKVKTQSHRDSLSRSHKALGKKLSEETKQKILQTKRERGTMVSGMKGKHHSDETKQKISDQKRGKPSDPVTNAKRSEKLKGMIPVRVVCPHCGKEGASSPMLRWHFDNCKEKYNVESEEK